jgi:hypothetical protein
MIELSRLRACALAAVLLAAAAPPASAELFFDVGAHVTRLNTDIPEGPTLTATGGGAHFGIGVRRALARGNDIGIRLEAEQVDSNTYLAFRMLDYRFNFSERLGLGFFFGAARLDTGEAAYGWYFGAGVQFKELLPAWDLGIDLRFGDSLQRDSVLPTDPPITGPRDDIFYEADGISVYLSRSFGSRSNARDR